MLFTALLLTLQQQSPAPSRAGGPPDSYADSATAVLVARARAGRERNERLVTSYTAKVSQRIGVGIRARLRDRMLFRQELAAKITWHRDQPSTIEVVGARQAIPIAIRGDHVPEDLQDDVRWLVVNPAEDYLHLIGADEDGYDPFAGYRNIRRVTHRYSTRDTLPAQLTWDKLTRFCSRLLFRTCKFLHPVALNARVRGFDKILRQIEADVYIGHNIETLLPVCRLAASRGALAMFDCMEFYSDMGDSQGRLDRRMIRHMEELYLPHCDLVFASSEELSEALTAEYGIRRPIALYNVPPKNDHAHLCNHEGLSLYWRNAVIGFGQRGLQDALSAMTQLPRDVTLHLQGRLSSDGRKQLHHRINALGLTDRVFVHGPYLPPEAVQQASRFCVGLCLEHSGIRNHDLTVSNKIFDYLMAGLVVVASDLPGLRGVIEHSNGGLLFHPGDPTDLTAQIMRLYRNPKLRLGLAANARKFALTAGNREHEMQRFQQAFLQCLQLHPKSSIPEGHDHLSPAAK